MGKSPFIALVGIISNGEWRNDKNNATFPESVTKFLNILCDSLIAKSKKKIIIMEKAVSYQENVAGKIIIKIFTTDMFITTII